MIYCYLTGVNCHIEDAFVLNRRAAHELLGMLKGRVASLQRVIEQLSPLDDKDVGLWIPPFRRTGPTPKNHRLVCKAVANALAPGFPEISLFVGWPQYHTQARQTIRQDTFDPRQEQAAAPAVKDHETKNQP
jgi:hypothetical protein